MKNSERALSLFEIVVSVVILSLVFAGLANIEWGKDFLKHSIIRTIRIN